MGDDNGQPPELLSEASMREMLKRDDREAAKLYGLTLLHVACTLGDQDYVDEDDEFTQAVRARSDRDLIIELHGARQLVPKGSTPLHLAVMFGHEDVALSLPQSSASIHAEDSLGFTPLHRSMFVGKGLARELLRNCKEFLRDCVSEEAGLSHLHVAAWVNDEESVKALIKGGADIERRVGTDLQRFPFLGFAAGKTPTLLAIESRSYRALDVLLEHRLEPEIDPAGVTKLHATCASGHDLLARMLLQDGAEVDARIREGQLTGATPLCLVLDEIARGDRDSSPRRFHNVRRKKGKRAYRAPRLYEVVELLLKYGADVSVEYLESTPLCLLYQAVVYPKVVDDSLMHVVYSLLKSQKSYADNPRDKYGFSHFHFACVMNDVEVATKFLDHGADVNQSTFPHDARTDRPCGDSTPLHFAIAYACRDVARLLLERGADVKARDAKGRTPLQVADTTMLFDMELKNFVARFSCLLPFGRSEEHLVAVCCMSSEEDKDEVDGTVEDDAHRASDLLAHNESLLETGKFGDVTFVIGQKSLRLHKSILTNCSAVIEAAFHHMKEQRENVVEIVDVDFHVMKEMLRYVYARKVNNIENIAAELYVVADRYAVEGLKLLCENQLIGELNMDNALSRLELSMRYGMVRLKPKVLGFVLRNMTKLVEKHDFEELSSDCKDVLFDCILTKRV